MKPYATKSRDSASYDIPSPSSTMHTINTRLSSRLSSGETPSDFRRRLYASNATRSDRAQYSGQTSPYALARRVAARSAYRSIASVSGVSRSPLAKILASPLLSEKRTKELSSTYGGSSERTTKTTMLREEADMLESASEARVVVKALRRRLRIKNNEEMELRAEVKSGGARIEALQNKLDAVVKQKEMVMRDIEDERTKLSELRMRYAERAKDEVEILKKEHRLSIKYKDISGRIANKAEGEKYAIRARKEAQSRHAAMDRKLMQLKYDKSATDQQVAAERSRNARLKVEVDRKQSQLMRERHANKVEIEGLRKLVLEREATLAELQSEVAEANKEVRLLHEALEAEAETAELSKSRLERELRELVAKINDVLLPKIKVARERLAEVEEDLAESERARHALGKDLDALKVNETELNVRLQDARARTKSLEEKLAAQQKEHGRLESKRIEREAEAKKIESKTASVEAEYHTITKQERKELAAAEQIKKQIHEEELEDEDRKHVIETAKTYTRLLEDRMLRAGESLARAEAELETAQDRISGMSDKLEAIKREESRLNAEIEKRIEENEALDGRVREVESEIIQITHAHELERRALESKITDRAEVIDRLERELQISEATGDNLRRAMNQASEEALEAKEILERRITEVQAKDAKLRAVVREKESVVEATKSSLESKQDKLVVTRAELTAAEKEIVVMKASHARQLARLKSALASAEEEVRTFEPQVDESERKGAELERKYEAIVKRNEETARKTRQEETEAHKLESHLREVEKQSEESKASLERLEASLRLIVSRFDEKMEEASVLRKQINENATTVAFQRQVLANEQEQKERLAELLQRERAAIVELDRELKRNEGEYEADSLTVKAKISELQSALVERADAAEKLQQTLDTTQARTADLRASLLSIGEDAKQQTATLEKRLEIETEAVEKLRAERHRIHVEETTLRSDLARHEESVVGVKRDIEDTDARIQVAKGDVLGAKDEASMLQEKIDKRGNYETDLADKVEAKETRISTLKAILSKRAHEESNMMSRVHAIEAEIKTLRKELRQQKQSEQNLVHLVESTRSDFEASAVNSKQMLEDQADRAEASRAAYADTLLDILKREGVPTKDDENKREASVVSAAASSTKAAEKEKRGDEGL